MKRILLLCYAFLFVLGTSWAQRTVSGTVTSSSDGSTVPGVNVILKGTTTGTTTDLDGNYRLSVPEEGGTLVFTFIGLATKEVEIGARSVIDVAMDEDVAQLAEVVVTAIGIESDKKTLGYSIQNVDPDEIVQSKEANLVSALNGKIAGVNVYSSSGSPGASASIRIRGNTSVNLSNNPLFVVDGVPIDNSEAGNGVGGVDNSNRAIDINPNDIASLTVLKGPAATALYGIRAANGAIIVTTKRAEAGQTKVTVSASVGFNQVNKLPELQDEYAQGRPVGGVPTYRGPWTGEGFSWGPRIDGLEFSNDFNQFANLYLGGDTDDAAAYWSPDQSTYFYDGNGFLVPSGEGNGQPARAYDNYDNFFVTGVTQDYNVSLSGGTNKLSYYISAGNLYQTGIVPNADFNRTTALVKINSNITDKLRVGAQANFINSGGFRIQRGSNVSGVMLGLARNTPTFDIANGYTDGQEAVDDESTYLLPNGEQRSYRAGIYDSPFWTASKNPFEDDVTRLIGNVNLSYDLTNWISFSYKLGIDTYTDRRIGAFDINSAAVPAGEVTQQDITSRDINSDFLILINKDFDDFTVGATLGHNWYSNRSWNRFANGSQFAVPGFYHINNASTQTAGEGIGRRELYGVFGEVKLGYQDMLFLNVSARNDWSSTLSDDNNSFFYPSVSAGFAFSELLDVGSNSLFNYGKIRASWGQVGNDAPIYATQNYFNSYFAGGDGFIDGVGFPATLGTGAVSAFERELALGNQQLAAELTTTIEVGFEARFLRDRLGIDFTYYTAETDGQVINIDIAPSTGFTGALSNAGLISNDGFEIILSGTPVRVGDFSWDFNVNFTAYETTVEELDENIGEGGISLAGFVSTSSRAIAGQPYGVLYGNQYQRTDDGQLIIGSDGWPLASPDQGIIGDPNPDWLMGFTNTFSYKGFSLSGLIDIRQGGDMWNGTVGVINYFGMGVETELRDIQGFVFDGVQNEGDADNPSYVENTTPVDFYDPAGGPTATKWGRYGFGFSENEIEDASWIRLRQVRLGYQLPESILGTTFIDGVTVSVTGRNLLLFTNYTGIDPEANLTGVSNGFGLEYFGMPNTSGVTFDLKFDF